MTDQPNVVVFMTDQQRSVTVDGEHRLRAATPNLDAFAADATVFERAYAPSPHCCPSRTSFFSGLYPSEHGVWNNVGVPNALSRGPRPGTPFWSEDLARAGYDLGFSGKWHVDRRHGPSAHGWTELGLSKPPLPDTVTDAELRSRSLTNERRGLEAQRSQRGDEERQPGQIVRPGWPTWTMYGTDDNPFGDQDVVTDAVKFIDQASASEAPFALYVGTLGPHDPYTPPQEYLDLYDSDAIQLPDSFSDAMTDKPAMFRRAQERFDQLTVDEHRATLHHYLAFCSYEDALFGQVLQALRDAGQYDNTIVIYVSDHGDYTGEHGLWSKGLPSFLPAYQVPLLIKDARRGPDAEQAARSSMPLTLVDLGPTLLELCGVSSSTAVSGRSVAQELYEPADRPVRDIVFQSNGNESYGIQRIVLTQEWKLVVNLFDEDELYDRRTDPDEMTNLIARRDGTRRLGRAPLDSIPAELRDVVRDLYRRLWRFSLEHDDDITNGYILTAVAAFGPLDELTG